MDQDLKQAILKRCEFMDGVNADGTNSAIIAELLKIIEKQEAALEWIMPKVHQGNHEGEFQECQKATCQAYRQALTETTEALKRLAGQNE